MAVRRVLAPSLALVAVGVGAWVEEDNATFPVTSDSRDKAAEPAAGGVQRIAG